jgi:hypothetical protein
MKKHYAKELHQKKVGIHLFGQINFDIHVNEGDKSALNSTDEETLKEMSIWGLQT